MRFPALGLPPSGPGWGTFRSELAQPRRAGKAMFQMLGVFAEFERSIIQERAGLRRAKAEGKQLGRPRIPAELEAKIQAALKAPGRSEGVRKITT
jgi:DNA invertase Pin-like site-specific DNA recombinase